MGMKSKVLFVMATLGQGGAERSLINLLREMDKERFSVDLLLLKRKGIFADKIPDGVHLLETPWQAEVLYHMGGKEVLRHFSTLHLYAVRILGTFFSRLGKKTIPESRAWRWKYFYSPHIPALPGYYDTAVAYITEDAFWFVSEKVRADRKLVWVHNDYRMDHQPRDYDLPHLKRMDAIVTVSELCRNVLLEEFPAFKDKIFSVPNLLVSETVRSEAGTEMPEEWRQEPEKRFRILSVGRLHPQKGFDLAVDAAVLLKKRGIRFGWYVIGEGKERGRLEEKIKQCGVGDCFVLLGGRENPYPYIRSADLIVQTSRYEGKSVVLDEAKILGRPILSTAYSTADDQIKNGKEGMLVEMTAEAVSAGIAYLAENGSVREKYESYLKHHEYGNEKEIRRYYQLLLGKTGGDEKNET